MILQILTSLSAVKKDPKFDSPKPIQPGDIELGPLEGLALMLYHRSFSYGAKLQTMEAELYELRAKAVRSQTLDDVAAAEAKRTEILMLCRQSDLCTRLFRLELAEEFNVTDPNMCVGVRQGFKVVKYAGPPADGNRTVVGIIGEIVQ